MKPRDIALALAAPILWGVGFTFAKPALAQFPPMLMMVMIYVATILLLIGRRRPLRTPLWAVLVIGACGGAVQSILIFSGLSHLPASTAVLVVQSQVPFRALRLADRGKERLSVARSWGSPSPSAGGADRGRAGVRERLSVAALVVLAHSSGRRPEALIRYLRPRRRADDDRHDQAGLGTAGACGIAAVRESGNGSVQTATLGDWGALALVFLLGYLLAYSAWYQVLAKYRVDQVTPFILLMPIAGVITGALALGEELRARVLIGGAIILVGLWIVVRVAAAPAPVAAVER